MYERLKARKRPVESFADLRDRLTDREDQFEQGFGGLADVDFESAIADLDERLENEFRATR